MFACNPGMTTRRFFAPPGPTLTLVAALLAGCATQTSLPPVQPPPVAPAPKAAPAAPAFSLEAEQKRLAGLFRDTPVVIAMTPEGHMRVEVPLKFSFDKGRTAVKPPLAAVLDRIAPSAKAGGMRTRVAAPGDNGTPGTLARDRAASARDYLVGKGVPATTFSTATTDEAEIEIVIGRM